MLYHTLAESDMAVVYRYLTHNLLPMAMRADLQQANVRSCRISSCGVSSGAYGRQDATFAEPTHVRRAASL